MDKLETLDLEFNNITDAGLTHLEGLTRLETLVLEYNSEITDAGVAELQKALPNCKIKR